MAMWKGKKTSNKNCKIRREFAANKIACRRHAQRSSVRAKRRITSRARSAVRKCSEAR